MIGPYPNVGESLEHFYERTMEWVDLNYNTYDSPLDPYRNDGSEMPGGDIIENGGSNRDPGNPHY